MAFGCQPWPQSRSKSLLFADDDAAMGDTGGSGSATVDSTRLKRGEDGGHPKRLISFRSPYFCVFGCVFFRVCIYIYVNMWRC